MCSILLVEDNNIFRRSLKEMLTMHFPAMGIHEASNADEALDLIDAQDPDLIFMDIKLPGKNGLELTRAIKRAKSDIHVIIFTSYDLPEYRDAAFRCGASHFFTKGEVKSEELAAAVSSALERKCEICPGNNGPH